MRVILSIALSVFLGSCSSNDVTTIEPEKKCFEGNWLDSQFKILTGLEKKSSLNRSNIEFLSSLLTTNFSTPEYRYCDSHTKRIKSKTKSILSSQEDDIVEVLREIACQKIEPSRDMMMMAGIQEKKDDASAALKFLQVNNSCE